MSIYSFSRTQVAIYALQGTLNVHPDDAQPVGYYLSLIVFVSIICFS